MKIAAVKTYVLSAALEAPFAYSQAWYATRTALIVEVVSDEGLSGFGEVYGPARPNRAVVEAYAPLLIAGGCLRDRAPLAAPLQPLARPRATRPRRAGAERHRHRAVGSQGQGARAAGSRADGRPLARARARLRHRPLPPRPPRPRDLSARGGRHLCDRGLHGHEAEDRLGRRRRRPPHRSAPARDRTGYRADGRLQSRL